MTFDLREERLHNEGKKIVVLNESVIAGRSGVSYIEKRTAILVGGSKRLGCHDHGCIAVVMAKEEGGDL